MPEPTKTEVMRKGFILPACRMNDVDEGWTVPKDRVPAVAQAPVPLNHPVPEGEPEVYAKGTLDNLLGFDLSDEEDESRGVG